MMDDESEAVGKGRPPVRSRFKPGQSGNPKGRPRGKRSTHPEDAVLDQMVTIRENGVERVMRADHAFLLQITSLGLAKGGPVARAALSALESRPSSDLDRPPRLIVMGVYADPGDVGHAIRNLNIATLLDRFRPTASFVLETWVVEAALARLGDEQLNREEQEAVIAATRFPNKVRWPSWWRVDCL